MEWLLSRRRMMYYKNMPPVYLAFVDSRVWEICCYKWGDSELVQGAIKNGTIDGNGSSMVYSDYIFAHCTTIPSHKMSNGSILSKAAAIQEFTLTVNVTDDPFSGQSDETEIIKVWSGSTAFCTITKADFISGVDNGEFTTPIFETTNTTKYLRVSVLADSGASVSWTLNAITGSYRPVGITLKQCAAVTTFGNSENNDNAFYNNILITTFPEMQYFTKMNSLRRSQFNGCTNLTYIDVRNIHDMVYLCVARTKISSLVFDDGFTTMKSQYPLYQSSSIKYLDLPSTTKSMAEYSLPHAMTVVCRATTPPSLYNSSKNKGATKIYVPQESYDAYASASGWSYYATNNKLFVIEGTWYETHRELEPTT